MKINKRMIMMICIDIVLINISIILSYILRLGRNLPAISEHLLVYSQMAIGVTLIKLLIFYLMGLYKPMWKYATLDDVINVFLTVCVANGAIIIILFLFKYDVKYSIVPRSIYFIATLLDFILIIATRLSKRIINKAFKKDNYVDDLNNKIKRVMVVGGGEAGGLIIQEMRNHPKRGLLPVCIIDDDINKKGRKLINVPIVGNRNDICKFANLKKIDQIIIAIPSIKKEPLNLIVDECKKTNCELKIVPFINQIQNIESGVSEILLKRMRNIDIEDLLGREPIKLDNQQTKKYIKDNIVMVTGGGGSIGSELCRQIAAYSPKQLIILDIYENNAYDIQNELKLKYKNLDLVTLIASIRDREAIFNIFKTYKPDIVFHAAAHKHVPLMEASPKEAIKNNVFGTLNVVQACDKYNVKRFVQISTDKAVNPTNVYGASKRLCEIIEQTYAKISKTNFVAVRFGNVLGSNGSVIPLFKKQIANGGPVTVTHPEIIRYFMTIPEAIQLVLEAGGMAKGGEIFILDMGEPIKIDKLARDLIKLSGFEPDEDIEIIYTGLRPGEKLYEELLMSEEGINNTSHNKIYIAKPMEITIDELNTKLQTLKEGLKGTNEDIVKSVKQVVPTYKTNDTN